MGQDTAETAPWVWDGGGGSTDWNILVETSPVYFLSVR